MGGCKNKVVARLLRNVSSDITVFKITPYSAITTHNEELIFIVARHNQLTLGNRRVRGVSPPSRDTVMMVQMSATHILVCPFRMVMTLVQQQ